MIYDDASKRLVLSFKHSDRLHPVRAMAGWMFRAAGEMWATADIIIPVPLHRWRLFKRRYNQAALLSLELGRVSGKTVIVDAMQRHRATQSQGHMSRDERHENIKGTFNISPSHREAIKGKNIVLVDDVLTTGATVNECSRILKFGGAASVHVLTLARVRGVGN
jgi:ComF family protein